MTIEDAIQLAITPVIQDLRREAECVEQIKASLISAGYVIVPASMWYRPDDSKPSDVQ